MPITAGGTVFMYNLKIDGQQVTNLRLSGENIAKIFTGQITNLDDPALAADNPGLTLPNQSIVPVVRSDGAGDSFELTEWMISQYPSIWNAYCSASGRAPACGPTSFYPTAGAMIAQSGDLGVAGYVSQSYADGSIGYVELLLCPVRPLPGGSDAQLGGLLHRADAPERGRLVVVRSGEHHRTPTIRPPISPRISPVSIPTPIPAPTRCRRTAI